MNRVLIMFQVPNPLFDLAGIMCGQFGIPFWKFFLATLIGKAIIKTHIQVCDVLFVFYIEAEPQLTSVVSVYTSLFYFWYWR